MGSKSGRNIHKTPELNICLFEEKNQVSEATPFKYKISPS